MVLTGKVGEGNKEFRNPVTCELFGPLLPVLGALLEALMTGFFPTHSYSSCSV